MYTGSFTYTNQQITTYTILKHVHKRIEIIHKPIQKVIENSKIPIKIKIQRGSKKGTRRGMKRWVQLRIQSS